MFNDTTSNKNKLYCSKSCLNKLWIMNNKEKSREIQKKSEKKRNLDPKRIEYQKKRKNSEEYKEKMRIYAKNYRETRLDKDKRREYHKTYRPKYYKYKRETDILFKLKDLCRRRLNEYLKQNNYSKKHRTFVIIGCTPKELREHIEKQFKNNMCWENIEIDHIIPLSSATTENEIYKLSHYSNLQPLLILENRSKGAKYNRIDKINFIQNNITTYK